MPGAEVQHLLGLPDTTDRRSGQAAAFCEERERIERRRLVGRSHQHHRAVAAKEPEVGVVVVLRRHGIEDEVETTGVFLEDGGIVRGEEIVRAQSQRVFALARRVAENGDVRAHCFRELHAHVAETAQAHDPDFVARLHAKVAQR